MSILSVLTYPDPRLRTKALPVTTFDAALNQIIKDMFETMYEDQGCGLAATQVGINQRIFVMDISTKGNEPRCFINPEILSFEGECVKEEGCLSFPGISAKVKRPEKIVLRFFDEFGVCHEETFTGLGAICCDHEINHLDGILFVDFLSSIKRDYLLKKLKKSQRVQS